MKKIETKRLFLRESTFEDCNFFSQWERDPQVTEFFTIDKNRDYEEIVVEYLERKKDQDKLQFTICLKPEGVPIGRVYISNIDEHYNSLDITRIYIADKSMRGSGLGEEALRAVLKLSFQTMKRHRVTLDHFSNNKIAANLYLKVGFQYEGIMRQSGRKDGKYIDLHLMSMLEDEYQPCI